MPKSSIGRRRSSIGPGLLEHFGLVDEPIIAVPGQPVDPFEPIEEDLAPQRDALADAAVSAVAAQTLRRIQKQAKAAIGKELRERRMTVFDRQDLQAKLKEFYSEEATESRVAIFDDPRVRQAVNDLWDAANVNSDNVIDKLEYAVMHKKIHLWLEPMVGPRGARKTAEKDWASDSQGHSFLDQETVRRHHSSQELMAVHRQ